MRVQLSGSKPQLPESEEDYGEKCKREVDQARLDWQTRRGRHLEFRIKWRRFYRENPRDRKLLELLKDDAEKRIVNLERMTTNPVFVNGETWTKAAEILEETRAHLESLEEVLSRISPPSEEG